MSMPGPFGQRDQVFLRRLELRRHNARGEVSDADSRLSADQPRGDDGGGKCLAKNLLARDPKASAT
jgi:hypothetical protein